MASGPRRAGAIYKSKLGGFPRARARSASTKPFQALHSGGEIHQDEIQLLTRTEIEDYSSLEHRRGWVLKRGVQKGCVSANAPYERCRYSLAPKGVAEKSRLLAKDLKATFDRQTNVLRFHVLTVLRSMGDIEDGDVVAIADTRHSRVAFDLIHGVFPDDRMLAPSFLRVLGQQADFTPPKVAH